ncbi:hypothetical protein M422DRAFT_249262 [Sphaerobolus stellatus SS14]|uniref:triacylglycerol lipase n=1 Tax=Sphaerobolus stellatus (strain SS14) TaxID=990650 RepID=A0A0C9VI55_SPHS4|nr:hypothetical protein M422DRAFT_249262 [Sphaerobolus stellatus SS14]
MYRVIKVTARSDSTSEDASVAAELLGRSLGTQVCGNGSGEFLRRSTDSVPSKYVAGELLWRFHSNEACGVTGLGLFQGLSFDDLFKDLSWLKSKEVADLRQRANILGHKRLSKPTLVIEALGEIATLPKTIEDVLEEHCAAYPDSQMQLSKYPGLDHWSILFASQAECFLWVEDRFEGKAVPAGCSSKTLSLVN